MEKKKNGTEHSTVLMHNITSSRHIFKIMILPSCLKRWSIIRLAQKKLHVFCALICFRNTLFMQRAWQINPQGKNCTIFTFIAQNSRSRALQYIGVVLKG